MPLIRKDSLQRPTQLQYFMEVNGGFILNASPIFISAYSPDIDTAAETVWPEGGIYTWPTAASILKVSSASANDTSAGTGARTILISGLDENWDQISETITLNGTTAVNTTLEFFRVNSIVVLTSGSGQTNAGRLYAGTGTVTAGKPATVWNLIETGYSASTSAFYSVPRFYKAYFFKFIGFTDTISGPPNHIVIDTYSRVDGTSTWIRAPAIYIADSPTELEISSGVPTASKTDIEYRGTAVSNDRPCTIFNYGVLRREEL